MTNHLLILRALPDSQNTLCKTTSVHQWKDFGDAIDDRSSDGVTYRAISQISAGIKELSEAAPASP